MKHKLLTYLARVFCVVVASSPSILFGVLADHLTGLGVGIGVAAVVAMTTGYYIHDIEEFLNQIKSQTRIPMTHPIEQPQYWSYQVKATMPGQKPLLELLLAEKRTHKEAVEYCVNRWGDRFKIGTLKPYDPIKISKVEDARTEPLTQQERNRRYQEGVKRKNRLAKAEKAKQQAERKLWNVILLSGEGKAMTSYRRTREQAEKRAYHLYGSRVKFIEEWPQLPK